MDLLQRARTFVRVVESGSLSSAARATGASLPGVSRQITTLEEELGAPLLLRTTRSLRLTEEGRRFFEHATRLVREADAAVASVRRDRAVAGHLSVSASVSLGVLRVVPHLSKLLAAHPALDLELRLEDREAEIVREGVDVAIRAGLALPSSTSLVAAHLATFERVLVASPAYLKRHGPPREPRALASHASVVGPSSEGTIRYLEGDVERTVRAPPRLRVSTLVGIAAAAREGLGVAALPHFVVAEAIAAGELKRLLPRVRLPAVSCHALYRVEHRGAPRVDALLAHLRETLPFP